MAVLVRGPASLAQAQEPAPRRWQQGEIAQEEGRVGRAAKEVSDVVASDRAVHEDSTGRALHLLLDAAGVEGFGWALSWRDTRHGNLGLFVARLGLDGKLLEPERPFPFHGAAFREQEPCLGVGPGLSCALGYTLPGVTEPWRFMGRMLDRRGAFQGPQSMLGLDDARLTELAPEARAPDAGRTAELGLAARVLANGDGEFAWLRGGRIFSQSLAPGDGPGGHPGDGGKVRCLNPTGPAATGRPLFSVPAERASPPQRASIVCWPSENGAIAVRAGDDTLEAGSGTPLECLLDPRRSGGFWLVVDRGQDLALRHLSPRGKPDGEDIVIALKPFGHVDAAAWSEGLAILHQPQASRGREVAVGGRMSVRFLTPDGAPAAREPIDPLPAATERASAGRVAGAGDKLLIAWSELRGFDHDIYARILSAGIAAPGAEQRVNSDALSSYQKNPSLASNGTDRAVIGWWDSRAEPNQPYLRVLDGRGAFQTPELRLPAALAGAGGARPGPAPAADGADQVLAAVLPDGKFLAVWTLVREFERRVRAQLFMPSGAPLGPDFDVEAEPWTCTDLGIAALALPGRGGFAVGWPSRSAGYLVRRITSEGSLGGAPRAIGEMGTVGDLSLCALDDGRAIAVWDQAQEGGASRLRARFLGPDLEPLGHVVDFDTQWRGSDHDPSVAPGPAHVPGSFALAWVVGDDASRDVFFRVFDAAGVPLQKPVALTAIAHEQDFPSLVRVGRDAWVCAWEDDISYLDHTYVRSIQDLGQKLGPVRNLNQRQAEVYHENYMAPVLARVEGGLIAAWNDCRRGQGFDVFFKVFGLQFDRGPGGG